MLNETHIAALQALVSDKGLVRDAGGMAAYENGARYDEGRAALVLRPQTTEEVSTVVS